ncbi:MAG TPA: hypothetical protein VKV27_03005 [Solirubrobacteraceae bacterium]|nr:hypothetical protein [Solirubrobacteraceae bacterium]
MPTIRLIAGALSALAIAAPPAGAHGAIAAPTGKPTGARRAVLRTCTGTAAVAPRGYVLACGDGYTGLEHLRWAHWGAPTATATGRAFANDCTPSCVAGRILTWPVRVTASALRAGAYHRLTVTATGRRPKGRSRTTVYHIAASGPFPVL